jgi:serine/threonine-protein kinase
VASPAAAAPSASEKAAAEALFQEGTELMQKQSYPEACAKFEASNAIESGLGVKLWLADCYDRAGRTASAWALFTEASALAQKSGQEERERMAHERAGDLEKRLSKLELGMPAQGLPANYGVELDGVEIPSASVGSALPVDPGDHVIVVRAPGFEPHTLRETVPPGPTSMRLDLPPLTPLPAKTEKPVAAADARSGPAPGHTQRLLAYSLGGLGVLSLAGGGFLAYRAHKLDQDSLSYCLVDEPNACNDHGASLREQAQTYGNAATAAIIAGGALVTTGVVLLVTAPRKHEIRVGGMVTPGGAFVSLGGKL